MICMAKPKRSEKYLPQCHFVYIHLPLSHPGLNTGLCVEKPASNRQNIFLSCDTTIYLIKPYVIFIIWLMIRIRFSVFELDIAEIHISDHLAQSRPIYDMWLGSLEP
jgi:hypothetical protein